MSECMTLHTWPTRPTVLCSLCCHQPLCCLLQKLLKNVGKNPRPSYLPDSALASPLLGSLPNGNIGNVQLKALRPKGSMANMRYELPLKATPGMCVMINGRTAITVNWYTSVPLENAHWGSFIRRLIWNLFRTHFEKGRWNDCWIWEWYFMWPNECQIGVMVSRPSILKWNITNFMTYQLPFLISVPDFITEHYRSYDQSVTKVYVSMLLVLPGGVTRGVTFPEKSITQHLNDP